MPELRPDDAEVMQWTWVPWPRLVAAAGSTPFAFSPWCVEQIGALVDTDDTLIRLH